ncbi:hypothetical protein MMA231_01125 [Asticcacaulis sp. MM231]|uniref:DUF1501 domain-containing protein n=1 Tax=Asticcacaulis sp. MM231 TaxID=3157666 RepID=UPI0032D5AB50
MAFIGKANLLSRRAFLQRAAQLSFLGTAAPLAMNLAAFGEAAAFDTSDYKALVCVFLNGGNDHANTVVPYDTTNYDLYSAIRGGGSGRTQGGAALARADLAATALTPLTAQTLTDNMQYALAPELTSLKSLFSAGKLAVQLNVGPLLTPLTLAQYNSSNRTAYPLPPKLFSHNDQQSIWQSLASEGARAGWGGRLADLALSGNSTSSLTCISASGNAVYLSGKTAVQYEIGTGGATAINGIVGPKFGRSDLSNALRTMITSSSANLMENEYNKVTTRSIALQSVVTSALSGVNLTTNFHPNGGANKLADQLKIVARLIGARTALGVKRQVFFVSLGGFDNHDGLMTNHPRLMGLLNEAMGQFYQATVELGVASKVTTFTASDFGRTLSYNGDGTDHGWGGHHFVMGGAVKGGQFYGTAPHVAINTDDQVGQGRLLPSTSVDQLAATLATWFGVSASELPTVLPNIGRFATSNLGFMA